MKFEIPRLSYLQLTEDRQRIQRVILVTRSTGFWTAYREEWTLDYAPSGFTYNASKELMLVRPGKDAIFAKDISDLENQDKRAKALTSTLQNILNCFYCLLSANLISMPFPDIKIDNIQVGKFVSFSQEELKKKLVPTDRFSNLLK